jgi:hypothetical protein
MSACYDMVQKPYLWHASVFDRLAPGCSEFVLHGFVLVKPFASDTQREHVSVL